MIDIKYIWFVLSKNPFKVRNHVHNCYELIFYLNAKGHTGFFPNQKRNAEQNKEIDYLDFDISDESKEYLNFDDNYLILIPPKIIHDEFHEKSPNIIDIGFEFTDNDLSIPITVLKDESLEFLPIMTKIQKEMEKKDNYYKDLVNALVSQLVFLILRHLNQDSKNNNPMLFARNYIDEYFTTQINISDLASQTGYGPEHFRFLFNKHFGMSPKEYIVKKRIEYAMSLLENSNYKISKIAELSGYDDFSQFSVIFKKKLNMTPFQYKRQHKSSE